MQEKNAPRAKIFEEKAKGVMYIIPQKRLHERRVADIVQ
jgi:hypothetical protein